MHDPDTNPLRLSQVLCMKFYAWLSIMIVMYYNMETQQTKYKGKKMVKTIRPILACRITRRIYTAYISLLYSKEWDTKKYTEIFSTLFSPLEDKSHVFAPPCIISSIYQSAPVKD